MKGVQKSYMIASMNFIFFAVLNQNRWSLNRTNDKLKYSLIGNGIWWISLPRETDYLKVSGAKETRQKRADVWIYLTDVDGGGSYDSKTIPTASGR